MTACRTVPFARSLRRAAVAAATLACALAAVPEVGASQTGPGAGAAHAAPGVTQVEAGAGTSLGVGGEELALKLRALTELGARYEHSEGMGRDFARAHDLYCEAARADYADALIRLGWMYANGRGVQRDDSMANTLFRRAADGGSELAGRLAGAIRGDETRLPECMTV